MLASVTSFDAFMGFSGSVQPASCPYYIRLHSSAYGFQVFYYSTILLFLSSNVKNLWESLGNTFTSKCHNVLHCSKKLYMHIFYLVELLFGYHFFVLQTIGTVTFMLHHIMLFSEFWVQIGHMNLPCWPTESYFERAVHHTSQHFWHIWTMDHCCLKKKKSPKFGQWGTVVH